MRSKKRCTTRRKNPSPRGFVSLHKSYVRPIGRGKNGKEVEFGAKVQLSCVDGYLLADHLSFDNFNESTKLETSVESFQRRFDKLPEHIAMDQIYGTRENRKYLEEKNIRASVKPLGSKAEPMPTTLLTPAISPRKRAILLAS